MEILLLHELTACVTVGLLYERMLIHNVSMGTVDLYGLNLCVPEDFVQQLLCIHNVGIETFDLHGLTFCVYKALS